MSAKFDQPAEGIPTSGIVKVRLHSASNYATHCPHAI